MIPHQPPAGKVEYRVVLDDGGRTVTIPEGDAVVARFRAEVPAGVLIPHILAMFTAMMLATRSLLEEFRPHRPRPRRLVLATMVLLVVGGLFLGPAVQKYAFDAWWTGWPNGTDLTDNKTALATLAWLPATLLALRNRPPARRRHRRLAGDDGGVPDSAQLPRVADRLVIAPGLAAGGRAESLIAPAGECRQAPPTYQSTSTRRGVPPKRATSTQRLRLP